MLIDFITSAFLNLKKLIKRLMKIKQLKNLSNKFFYSK